LFTADELRGVELFSGLAEADLQRLARKAADVRLEPDEWLIREGEPPWFFVLFEGRLRMVKDFLGGQKDLYEYDYQVGDFFGEVPLLMGTSAMVSLRAETRCRVARFDRQHFQGLIQQSKVMGALIIAKMMERIGRMQKYATTAVASRVVILGTEFDTDCRDIRAFLSANRIPYEWVDRALEPERVPVCVPVGLLGPAVVIDGETCIHPPTVREVAQALQLQTEPRADRYDVVIVGAGPAGMAAGLYGASEGLKVLMAERSAAGGQAGTSSRIENYLGFPEGISGEELTGRALRQAMRFGAEIAMTRSIEALLPSTGGYALTLDGGKRVLARAVLLATGVDWRRLKLESADRLLGRGVLYGASRTEAFHVNGKRAAIIGGGNSAGQAAMFFANYASRVTLVVRGEGLRRSMSQYLIGQLASKGNVEVLPWTQVVAVQGEEHLERMVTRTQAPGEEETVRTAETDALFVMIGADAVTGWLPVELERDEKGYLLTGRDLRNWQLEREAFPLETSLPGVFCAGDVRHSSIKRVSSGVGEGSMAIAFIHQYLALQGETELSWRA
jgi:thioredoxin reductase (NADPH)